MIKKPITIQLASGLEPKSIMGMMTLGLSAGESVVVSAEGEDEAEAIENIEKYLSSGN